MAGLIGETHHLVLDGGTIPGPNALDEAGEERRAGQATADDVVGLLAGVGDMAVDLSGVVFGAAKEGEHRHGFVTGLGLQDLKVDGAAVQAGRGTSLEPGHPEGQVAQPPRQSVCRRVAKTTALVAREADVNPSGEEGPHCEYDAGGRQVQTKLGDDPGDPPARDHQVIHRLLEDIQPAAALHRPAHRRLVKLPVRLGAGRPHRRPLAGVEDAELDTCPIHRPRHEATEGVDLLDQMAFADPANCRIATHLADGFDVVRQEQGSHAHAGCRQGRFGSGMATADDDDIVTRLRGHCSGDTGGCSWVRSGTAGLSGCKSVFRRC